ncbi:DUF5018 domain-containing protein [Ichthyobacterium seriolicida]|uniref:Pkd domain containing protein n=1 Tax=Ichthyobacterium seriolicida TaxID=242600 RepID=A0A1J1E193_9FLAO|nr:hypothetical protein [Ichthyobacterium seriolicida]BAV94717.1 hypothetical protein JBKA6_0704 [Ichthyobacterium seriolicida]
MKTFSLAKRVIFSFVLLSVIIFSCEKNNVYQDDLGVCIDSFALLDSENDQKKLGSDIKCDIDHENYTISLIVPISAELRGLKFNITPCEGVSISPASGEETDFEPIVEESTGEETATDAFSEGTIKKPSLQRYKKVFTVTKGDKSQEYTVYIAKESAPKLTEFKISANESKGIKGEVTAVITDDTDTATGKILLKIPYTGTAINLVGLTSVINVPEGYTIDPASGSAISESIEGKEFSLTTALGSKRVYTVEVVKGPYISAFKFPASNSGINADISATNINHDTGKITITVPSGVTLSSLTPTIEVGDNTKPDFTPSAQTDFSQSATTPVEYTVTSSNPSATDFTKAYTVTITRNAEPQIGSFTFTQSNNSSKNLGNDISGTIDHNSGTITVKVPHNANISALTPTITAASTLANTQVYSGDTGQGAIAATSFEDSHDGSVKYSAVGPAGGRKVYSVKVYKEPKISTFKFERNQNSDVTGFPSSITEYSGTVTDNNNITITVANTVNIANLKASITGDNISTSTATIDIAFDSPTGGSTYSKTIIVQNEHLESYTKEYTVTVTKEAAPKLTSLTITANPTNGIAADVQATTITHPNGSTNGAIKLKFPYNVASRSDEIVLTNLSYTNEPIAGCALTPVTPVTESIHGKTFTLTTTLGSTSEYTVTAVKGPYIESFKFESTKNNEKNIASSPITGAIDHENNTIKVTLPATVKKDSGSANTITLTPTIELGGDAPTIVSPNTESSIQFTSDTAVPYTVKGADGMEKIYKVTVTRTPSTIAQITKFTINSDQGNITETISGTANNKGRIVVPVTSVPANSVTPTIEKSDYSNVSPSAAQTFSYENPITYTVTAEDTSITKSYDVYIYDNAKTITDSDTLKVTKSDNTDITPDSTNIDTTTRVITVTVPSGTTGLDSLTLTLTDTSSRLSIEPTEAQDFSDEKEVKYILKESGAVKGHYWVKVVKSS